MGDIALSPLAPAEFPALPAISGVRLGAVEAGIRYKGRVDLTLAELAPGTTVAGTFTRNSMPGAPVDWCRKLLPSGAARALLVKAGNANVFTGRQGWRDVEAAAAAVGHCLDISPETVFIASTGVIGERLPPNRVQNAVGRLSQSIGPDGWRQAADAILTTDTFAKGATATAKIAGQTVRINGIAKGSGMIAPDMATMLAFLFTDADIPAPVLQALLRPAVDRSFNAITVDSDTSTSDTVLLFATGQTGHGGTPFKKASDPRLRDFREALQRVSRDLALQIVRDGEGAQKLIQIDITGAASARAARVIGLAVANSPLVKTAIAGADANWGRIVMAVGKAGEKADRDRLQIAVGGVAITADGAQHPEYQEIDLADHMAGRDIHIAIDVGIGRGRATVWTCDLTHGYIEINADYRS